MNFADRLKEEASKYKPFEEDMFTLTELDEAVAKAGAALIVTPMPGLSAKDKLYVQEMIMAYMEIVKKFLKKGDK